jgi:hypothetical protein
MTQVMSALRPKAICVNPNWSLIEVAPSKRQSARAAPPLSVAVQPSIDWTKESATNTLAL